MNQKTCWHVIFTKLQCERKVLIALNRKGYQCYCPFHPGNAQWKSQDKFIAKPLFNSFVFVRCTEEQFPDIKKTAGVINFLYKLDRPAVVSKEDMTAIMHTVNQYEEITVLKTSFNSPASYAYEESENFTHALLSLGFTLIAKKEKAVASTLITTEEPVSTLQRLSYRFRLAWR